MAIPSRKSNLQQLTEKISFLLYSCLFAAGLFIQPAFCQGTDKVTETDVFGQTKVVNENVEAKRGAMEMRGREMDIVHPFFTHMGMPEAAGHYALRLSGSGTDENGTNYGDFGFHLETGLTKRTGLHVRNDRVSNNTHTEVMLQYAAIKSQDGMRGLSPFVELEIPTHKGEQRAFGLAGFSFMWSSPGFELNQSAEYSPDEKALEGSFAVTAKTGRRVFTVIEFVFASAGGGAPRDTMIAGIKYQWNTDTVFGISYQFPVTDSREFTSQVLLQVDLEW